MPANISTSCLVFIKYVSDAFDLRRDELSKQEQDAAQDCYLDPAVFLDPIVQNTNKNLPQN